MVDFYVEVEADYGIHLTTTLKPKRQPSTATIEEAHAANEQGIELPVAVHPDLRLVTWLGEQITIIMPRLTTEFWDHEANMDAERKLNAN